MKKIGIKDIAEHCGVSIATVSYVINGVEKVSEEKKKIVMEAIKELDYNPNLNARALSKGESRLIGILLPLVEEEDKIGTVIGNNPFYMEFIAGVELSLQDQGYDILISGANNNLDLRRWLSGRSLDGIIVFGSVPKEFLKTIVEQQIPCCLVDSEDAKGRLSVAIDDELGGYLATEHLLSLGHRKIGFAGASLSKSNVNKKRWQGYRRALNEKGLEIDDRFVFEDDVSYESGKRIAGRILAEKTEITGLVCTSDIIAIGVIKEYSDRRISIPEHLSVVGFDDIKISSYITPGLTTIKQDVALKAKLAAEYLIHGIAHRGEAERQTILVPSLVIRNSTRKIG